MAFHPLHDAIFLGLGSNQGDRQHMLHQARLQLQTLPDWQLLAASSLYQTAPWGNLAQAPFLNQVIACHISLDPWALLQAIQDIEQALGRHRTVHWGPRTLDIDLLAYGQRQIRSQRLTIPHPYLSERAFVLIPWAEIAPDFQPPSLEMHIQALVDQLPDSEKKGVLKT